MNYNIGSPISDPFNSRANDQARTPTQIPPNAPTYDPWAAAANRQNPVPPRAPGSFNPREWNVSDKKVSKALTLFNGHAQHSRNWSDRMKDHCKEVNCGYGEHFDMIESQKKRISGVDLRVGMLSDEAVVDWKWLSQHLWVLIGKKHRQRSPREQTSSNSQRIGQWV